MNCYQINVNRAKLAINKRKKKTENKEKEEEKSIRSIT
jgi:hypothetical protein